MPQYGTTKYYQAFDLLCTLEYSLLCLNCWVGTVYPKCAVAVMTNNHSCTWHGLLNQKQMLYNRWCATSHAWICRELLKKPLKSVSNFDEWDTSTQNDFPGSVSSIVITAVIYQKHLQASNPACLETNSEISFRCCKFHFYKPVLAKFFQLWATVLWILMWARCTNLY
jgi:hypothetical protein